MAGDGVMVRWSCSVRGRWRSYDGGSNCGVAQRRSYRSGGGCGGASRHFNAHVDRSRVLSGGSGARQTLALVTPAPTFSFIALRDGALPTMSWLCAPDQGMRERVRLARLLDRTSGDQH